MPVCCVFFISFCNFSLWKSSLYVIEELIKGEGSCVLGLRGIYTFMEIIPLLKLGFRVDWASAKSMTLWKHDLSFV